MPHNHCYGCGPLNSDGLRLKSYWSGNELSVASFTPETHHCAGPRHFVNGGIIATLIDCHSICTAVAMAYRDAGRAPGSPPDLHYATSKLEVEYLRPTPIDDPLRLEARIVERAAESYVVSCELASRGKTCARATVVAVRVPESWVAGPRARG